MPRRPRAEYEITALDRTQKAFTSVQSGIERTTQKFRAVGGVAAAVTSGAFGAFANQALRNARELNRMSQALDINVEQAQRLEIAFRRFGLQTNDVSDAINTLTDRAEDAKDGMQSFIDDFKLVGLEVDELRDKDPAELFKLFADAVEDTEDANKRNAAVVRILGDDLGNRLLPALKEGSSRFNELGDEADRAGRIMSEDQVQAMVDAERSLDGLIQTIKDRAMETFSDWADEVQGVADAMKEIIDKQGQLDRNQGGLSPNAQRIEELSGQVGGMSLGPFVGGGGLNFLVGEIMRQNGVNPRSNSNTGNVDPRFQNRINSALGISEGPLALSPNDAPTGQNLLVTRRNAEDLSGAPLPRDRFENDPLGFGGRRSTDEIIRRDRQFGLFNFGSRLSMDQQADTLEGARPGEMQSPSEAMVEAMREDGDEIIDIQERIKDREIKIAEQRKEAQQDLANFKKRSEEDIVNTSLKLAQTLAQGNEDVSKIIFAVEKGLAVAEIIMNTQTAAMRALAELGPVAGPPAAANIEALGYSKAALVGALGIAQAATSSQGGGGGGSGGGSANIGNQQPNQNLPDLSQETRDREPEVRDRIIINGDVYDSEKLAENLAKVVGDKDIEIVPRNSRNAREIRRG